MYLAVSCVRWPVILGSVLFCSRICAFSLKSSNSASLPQIYQTKIYILKCVTHPFAVTFTVLVPKSTYKIHVIIPLREDFYAYVAVLVYLLDFSEAQCAVSPSSPFPPAGVIGYQTSHHNSSTVLMLDL